MNNYLDDYMNGIYGKGGLGYKPHYIISGEGLEEYDKVINLVNKYYYFIVSPNRTILLSSSNDLNEAKTKALKKLEPKIDTFIGKKLVFVKIINTYNEFKNETNTLGLTGGPIAFEIMSGLIEDKNKIKNIKETGNNKIYLSRKYIKENINDISSGLKKSVEKFLTDFPNKSFMDVSLLRGKNEKNKYTVEEALKNIESFQTELKEKNLNKGFWVIASRSDFKPLEKQSKIIVRLKDIKEYIIKGNEKKLEGEKMAFIDFSFDNDFLKLPIDEIKKNYSKYSNLLVCKLIITIQVIGENGIIGKRNWECKINFELNDLLNYKLKYKDAELFMRNTADKLVLTNNWVGIPYQGYILALKKKIKNGLKNNIVIYNITQMVNKTPKTKSIKVSPDEMYSDEESESESEEEAPPPKARGRPKKVVVEKQVIVKTPKTYKTGNIMKGKSDLIKMKTGKYAVEAEINLRKGLEPKVKRALKKAVDQELDKRIKGGRIIDLDYSSDSSSDEEDIKQYGKLLKHLTSHIKDPKEMDPKDFKDAIELIKRIKAKKLKGKMKGKGPLFSTLRGNRNLVHPEPPTAYPEHPNYINIPYAQEYDTPYGQLMNRYHRVYNTSIAPMPYPEAEVRTPERVIAWDEGVARRQHNIPHASEIVRTRR